MPPTPLQRPGAAAPAVAVVNFGDDAFYSAGARLPEGDYCMYHEFTMHTPTDRQTGAARGAARLGVLLTAYNLHDPQAEPKQQHLSLGSNAHLSYAPNPADGGKSLVAVPGGPGGPVPASSNWSYYRKSMLDCGLPQGVLVGSLEAIDGIHVHIQNVPEPDERKAFRNSKQGATGEAAAQGEDFKGPSTIPVVTEIKDTGKPWEGTGGIDVTKPATPAPVAKPATSVARPPAPVAPKPAPGRPAPPAPPAAAAVPAGDLSDQAMNAIAAVLGVEANVNGMTKLKLRTETFKQVDAETGNLIVNTYFKSDDKLNEILNQLGYTVNGAMVSPQQA